MVANEKFIVRPWILGYIVFLIPLFKIIFYLNIAVNEFSGITAEERRWFLIKHIKKEELSPFAKQVYENQYFLENMKTAKLHKAD